MAPASAFTAAEKQKLVSALNGIDSEDQVSILCMAISAEMLSGNFVSYVQLKKIVFFLKQSVGAHHQFLCTDTN
jgi:hypothetical protein